MMNCLYSRAYIDVFHGTWVPIMYAVATKGTVFNWASILASALRTNIATAKHPETDQPLEFYMASYLLNAVCARCHFDH